MQTLQEKFKQHPHQNDVLNAFFSSFSEWCNTHDIQVKDKWLYAMSFMHSSFVSELGLSRIYNNERLEFLGDAVLELNVSTYLYDKYRELPEGELTKHRASIVCEPSLVVFSQHLNMTPLIMLGKGELKSGGRERPSIISDAFEAFLGALYLDQGNDAVQSFLESHVFVQIKDIEYSPVMDFKTTLQEYVHKVYGTNVSYNLIEESGPSHDKTFTSSVTLKAEEIGRGTGRSKKESEQRAAAHALNNIAE